jgi:hypothetical protein
MSAKAHEISQESAKCFVFTGVQFWELKKIKNSSKKFNLNKELTI